MKLLHLTLAVFSILAIPFSCARASNLEFSGTFLAPPGCFVSDRGGRLEVRFSQNIAVNRIDGVRYRQAIPYQIECPGASEIKINWHMRLTLKGNGASFDTSALKTSVNGLGIKLLLGSSTLAPNVPRDIDFSASKLPSLEAVPVKLPDTELPSAEFTASALLIAELY